MTIRVLFNENCPICNAEICHYRKYAEEKGIELYFDKLGEHEFLEEAKNYWDDMFDEVVEEVRDYMKCDFKRPPGNTVRHP